jgi:hypothetical protein
MHSTYNNCGCQFISSFANGNIWFHLSAVSNLSTRGKKIGGAGRGWGYVITVNNAMNFRKQKPV